MLRKLCKLSALACRQFYFSLHCKFGKIGAIELCRGNSNALLRPCRGSEYHKIVPLKEPSHRLILKEWQIVLCKGISIGVQIKVEPCGGPLLKELLCLCLVKVLLQRKIFECRLYKSAHKLPASNYPPTIPLHIVLLRRIGEDIAKEMLCKALVFVLLG